MAKDVVIGVRDLSRRTSALIDDVASGQTLLVTRNGQPVAMLIPVDDSFFEDFVLATADRYVQAQHEALEDLAAGRVRTQSEMERDDPA